MIIDISIEQWAAPYGAENEPGLLIPYEDFNINLPVVQVYRHVGGNDYQLIRRLFLIYFIFIYKNNLLRNTWIHNA